MKIGSLMVDAAGKIASPLFSKVSPLSRSRMTYPVAPRSSEASRSRVDSSFIRISARFGSDGGDADAAPGARRQEQRIEGATPGDLQVGEGRQDPQDRPLPVGDVDLSLVVRSEAGQAVQERPAGIELCGPVARVDRHAAGDAQGTNEAGE